jgi:hypothetical protein
MTPFRRITCAAIVAALAAGGGTANAGWDNVFQVCCDSCRQTTVAASPWVAAAPVSDCGQHCTTRYVQRSFYQPVTTFVQKTFCEPVTTFRTSFFWEPVTSFRVSFYSDPCSCACQQVLTPVTSFRLRSQCTPVTSYVQRVALQPVQSFQLSYYFEPQTTCCQTTIGAPVAAAPAGGAVVPAVPTVPATPAVPAAPPTVGEQRQPQLAVPPGVTEQREAAPSGTESQRYPAPASSQPMPRAPEGATYRPTPSIPPSVRLDRIVAAPSTTLQGLVVNDEKKPLGNVHLLFVAADAVNTRESTTADAAGRFQVSLGKGTWLVYTVSSDGKTEFRRQLEVRPDEQQTEMRLVSR